MPGLIGIYSKQVKAENAVPAVRKMQKLITHTDFYKKESIYSKDGIYASRSHIDVIQKEPQPFSGDNVDVWLDGEFYNREELPGGHRNNFNDAELLLKLYQSNQGFNFLEDIDGGYNAVIFDRKKNRLYLIADRYCRQHLYWTKYKKGIAWAPEIKAFTALPDFHVEINPVAVNEFLGTGNMIDDTTWLKGVKLMPASSVLSFDLNDNSIDINRYWWWDKLSYFSEPLDVNELAEEAVRLLEKSVASQYYMAEKSVGIALSGGKDSRAVLAAMPDDDKPVHAVTFGKKNSLDILKAAKAVKKKKCQHHIYNLSASNWLEKRFESIWWTDGQVSMIHLNGDTGINDNRRLFDNAFVGLGGEALSGRSHLYDNDKKEEYISKTYSNKYITAEESERIRSFINQSATSEIFYFDHRFRNFSAAGLKRGECAGIRTRVPLLNNRLMDFIYKIPYSYKKSAKLYDKMLLMSYPEIFYDLHWKNAGTKVSISQKSKYYWFKGKKRIRNAISKTGFAEPVSNQFADYNNWIRNNPASDFFHNLLTNEKALYPQFIEKQDPVNCLEEHLDGYNNTIMLCRFITFEIWLQQMLNGKFISTEEYKLSVHGK